MFLLVYLKKTVFNPTKNCYENIIVNYLARDGETSFGANTSTGHRKISQELINIWSQGSFYSKEQCLNYHYSKHGEEIGDFNIAVYVRMADLTRKTIISSNIKPKRKVRGVTLNTYRYELRLFYLHVSHGMTGIASGELVSFGKRYN